MKTVFNTKAELYDKYRWRYSKKAITWSIQKSGAHRESIVADFGAGTGILTLELAQQFNLVHAIEPDDAMAQILCSKKGNNIIVHKKYAHEVNEIANKSIDLIFVAHAIHWFDYEKTINEFNRILKTTGNLILIENRLKGPNKFLADMNEVLDKYKSSKEINGEYDYFIDFEEKLFPFPFRQTLDQYVKGLSSASFIPDRSNKVEYELFRKNVENTFMKYTKDNFITFQCETVVRIGKLRRNFV